MSLHHEHELRRSLATLDRRGFLRLTGTAAAAGLLPVGCGAAPEPLRPPPELELAVLTPRTYATFQAAALRILGPEGRARVDSGAVPVARRADARLARLPGFARPVQQALLALEFGVWPLVPKLRPFTSLSEADRDTVLQELMVARWDLSRALFAGVRSFTWLAFYSAPESHGPIGYPGPFGGRGATIGGRGATIADAMTYDIES